jgi:uncharacterized cupredoxin-like copper-binding protein
MVLINALTKTQFTTNSKKQLKETNMLRNKFHITYILSGLMFALTIFQTGSAEIKNNDHTHEMEHSEQSKNYGSPADVNNIDRLIEITANDNSFVPTSIAVSRGETIKFIVTNKGKLPHEWVLGTEDEQIKHNTQMSAMTHDEIHEHMQNDEDGIVIQPNQTQEIIWTFTTDLTQIQFACHVPGHYEANMYGTVIIDENGQ